MNQFKHLQRFSLFILLFVLALLSGCSTKSPPRNCPISEWLLNKADLPSGSIVNDVSSPVAEYPEESAGVTASNNQDLIYQVIGRYPSTKSARNKYNQSLKTHFRAESNGHTWGKPAEITFHSAIANQYNTACNIVHGKTQCRMIGQYEEYYVFFFSYISTKGINLEAYQDLLESIDQKMSQCLLK